MIGRIMLLSAPIRGIERKDLSSNESIPHLGLGYVAAYAKHAGYTVRILDAIEARLSLEQVLQEIAAFKPDLVGLTALTVHVKRAHKLAQSVKAALPSVVTVLGGCHASAIPEETAREFPAFDYVVAGEGELALLSIVEAENSRDPSRLRSSIYRGPGGTIARAPAAPNVDVDAGPMPAWEEFDLALYNGFSSVRPNVVPLPIATSRGCPYACEFCFKSMGSRVRDRSIDAVVAEMRTGIERFGATQIVFTDETFTLKRERVLDLCQRIVDEGFHRRVKWVCGSRVDYVDEELLRRMVEAGCELMSFGVETGSADVLSRMNKKFTLDHARAAFRAAHRAGLKTRASMILGSPGETEQAMRDSIDFVMELDPHSVAYAILTPFPGTKIYEWAKKGERGLSLRSSDWEDFGKQIGSALAVEGLPRATIEKYQRLGYAKFYLRPSRIRILLSALKLRTIPAYLLHNLKGRLRTFVKG